MESGATPEDAAVLRDTAAHEPDGLPGRTDDLRREHWIVPVNGPTHADPDGVAQAIARRDGTVILRVTCGSSRAAVLLDVSRAARLCTGIWEAAGIAQQLTHRPSATQLRAALSRLDESGTRHPHARRNAPPRRPRRIPVPAKNEASDTARMIGRQIRRIRGARRKSLRVIAGLAGMSASTLHRTEHGEREITLPEIVALASALQTAPTNLIRLPDQHAPQLRPSSPGGPLSPGAGGPAAG